ncbi:MAG: hypothetical protein KC800_16865, partial [Candidatus Eremiobacteraeota bacterium]|nr:hypothetical protein [Candidatus Eremiobacteraeota bacterium]
LGAMLGGLIGSMFGSMLDNLFGSSAPCCCHNMGRQYGPYNQQMGMDYGYPMPAYPYPPQGFPNPSYGQWGPAFPPQAPPMMPWGLPRISSPEVAPGRSEEIRVRNRPTGVRVDTEIHRGQDGTSVQVTDVQNRRNPDAALDTTTVVGPGGRIDTVSQPVEGGVQTDTLAQNADGSAATRETTLARENRTDVVVTDVDAAPGNMQVSANDQTVVVTNPGTAEGGAVQNQVDISEASSDGFFENLGRGINGLFGGEEEPQPTVNVNGADQVHVSRNEEGQATVSVGRNGQHQEVLTTAGDTDDSFIERAGEAVDNTISAVGHAVGDAAEAVGDVATGAWRTVTGWFR